MNDEIIDKYNRIILEHWDNIFALYEKFAVKKPVMLYDIQEKKIYAYPYIGFKNNLAAKSQKTIEKQYKEAIENNQIIVFIKDTEEEKLLFYTYDMDGS